MQSPEEKRKERLKKKKGNKPRFDLRTGLFRMAGVDLTQIVSSMLSPRQHSRERLGYEQMGDRTPFCFLATTLSGQSNQW